MSHVNSKTIKEIVYKKYLIKIKKDGECFTHCSRLGHVIWGEDVEAIKLNIDRNIRCNKLINKWDKKAA